MQTDMKEYIFNALNENGWVAQRIWDGYITTAVWLPLYIAAVIMLIIKYRKSKKRIGKYHDFFDILIMEPKKWIYGIAIIFVAIYSFLLIAELLILGNSIILYEIKH